MKKLISVLLLVFVAICIPKISQAQTMAYKYSHSVKDGMRVPGLIGKGVIFYFTFTNGKSMCYLTDKDGVYRGAYGQGSFQFIGTRNGMHVYQERSTNMFRHRQDMLYFSTDYDRLNWDCNYDDFSPYKGAIRVFNYVSDPDEVDVPSQLY